MNNNTVSVIDILNNLLIPQSYKEELLGSYMLVVLASLNDKYPLTETEAKEAVDKKQDLVQAIYDKYPKFLEDEAMLTTIQGINEKFAALLESLNVKAENNTPLTS